MGEINGAMAGEIAVVGVRTRARDQALAVVEASGSSSGAVSSSPEKKTKKASAMTAIPYDVHQLKSRRRVALTADENSLSSTSCQPGTSSSSDVAVRLPTLVKCLTGEISSDFPSSCTSSNHDTSSSGEELKDCMEIVADPEVESSLTSSKNSECRNFARGENKVVKALKSDDLDAKSTVQIKMPSNSAEIEEFFAVAEKDIQKRFAEKYNFDIAKDVPLEGRYEWVQIKP